MHKDRDSVAAVSVRRIECDAAFIIKSLDPMQSRSSYNRGLGVIGCFNRQAGYIMHLSQEA